MTTKMGNFFQETLQELKKVTWPTWNEVWQATLVVIIATFIMAVFIAAVDFVVSSAMQLLITTR